MTAAIIIVLGFFILVFKYKLGLCLMVFGISYLFTSDLITALLATALARLLLMFFKVK